MNVPEVCYCSVCLCMVLWLLHVYVTGWLWRREHVNTQHGPAPAVVTSIVGFELGTLCRPNASLPVLPLSLLGRRACLGRSRAQCIPSLLIAYTPTSLLREAPTQDSCCTHPQLRGAQVCIQAEHLKVGSSDVPSISAALLIRSNLFSLNKQIK